MQEAFGIVIWVVVVVGTIFAAVAFFTSAKLYDQIGKGGLSLRDGSDLPDRVVPTGAAALRERDEEIRQMLEARNARRARRGEVPLDVEAELAELTRATVDAGLALEIRELVEARNARRIRQGKEPLDVEAEVERQLRELG
jgi:hypothetical protein